jgi:hypothetical protein
MRRIAPILLTVAAVVLVGLLAGCGSSRANGTTMKTGSCGSTIVKAR